MSRVARIVMPGFPHRVTQRGKRRLQTFFEDGGYVHYQKLMAQWCRRYSVAVWAYCLMPNHVHLIVVPETPQGLHQAVGEAHRRYTRHVNFREGWRGHLWQGRFASFVMDEPHLMAALRYVELNPVRAGLAERPENYPWSSARAHVQGTGDGLVRVEPMRSAVGDWSSFLTVDVQECEMAALRSHERTGRPLGGAGFLQALEAQLGRPLHKRKPGPRGPWKKN